MDLKQWKCKECSATLGMVKRNGRGIRQLLLYRNAVQLVDDVPAEVDVIGVLEGTMMDIRCSACGSVRTWQAGQEASARREVRTYNAE
jgi:hypothetical protein